MVRDLHYNGSTLPKDITQELINFAEKTLNVPPSYLITKLHYEGLWGSSVVGRENNNWGGMTWNSSWSNPHKRPSGVTVTRGSKRPAIEGGYYIKYNTVQDFLTDWSHLIRRNGLYNVADSETFDEAVKGMFRYGGAGADYATMNVTGSQRRYQMYLEGMKARRNAINKANGGILDEYDGKDYSSDDIPAKESDGDGVGEKEPVNNGFDSLKLFDKIENKINDALSKDLFQSGHSQIWYNDFLRIQKQLNNTYKVNVNIEFKQIIIDIMNDLLKALPTIDNLPKKEDDGGHFNDDETEKPDDSDEPSSSRVFPMKIQNGVNFFRAKQFPFGSLQYEMGYVKRRNGNHYGYDIGGGGVRHPIYSVTDGEVVNVGYRNGIGNHVTIKEQGVNRWLEYGHLSAYQVNKGQKVKAGDRIATMGQSGGNYAIHLDLKINTRGASPKYFYNWNDTINPESFLKVTGTNKTALPQP